LIVSNIEREEEKEKKKKKKIGAPSFLSLPFLFFALMDGIEGLEPGEGVGYECVDVELEKIVRKDAVTSMGRGQFVLTSKRIWWRPLTGMGDCNCSDFQCEKTEALKDFNWEISIERFQL